MKTTLREIDDGYNPKFIRVVVKGASEIVVERCTKTLNEEYFDENTQQGILKDHISDDMAHKGLKVLTYAYKDISYDDYENILYTKDEDGNVIQNYIESPEFRNKMEVDLTYVGTFGLEDPLRDNIESSVNLIKFGVHETNLDIERSYQVNIRMMTGDHMETAKYVAI